MKMLTTLLTAFLISSVTYADNKTDNLSVTFETEEEFFEHLIHRSIDLYVPKTKVNVGLQDLFYQEQLSITVNLKDAQIKFYAPFGVLQEEFNGSFFAFEFKF
jgi:hypothetical protein|tara:strand:- start:566 stop:874 length:309 start_codon:yes stop_codon:yes gene_type:complete